MKVSTGGATKRPYRMQARADAAEDTGRRILDATIALYSERWIDQITLDDVAGRAGVTVQTVIRRFGSKDGLIAAAGDVLERRIVEQRFAAPVGDIDGGIHNLFDHYEAVADLGLRSLAQEDRYPSIAVLTERGRRIHHEWVDRTFAPIVRHAVEEDRRRLRGQLVALTDVYMWKLLRRDSGLDRDQAEAAVREMIESLPVVRRWKEWNAGGVEDE